MNDKVRKGEPSVAIKVEVANYETPRMYGRHFNQEDEIMSRVISKFIFNYKYYR